MSTVHVTLGNVQSRALIVSVRPDSEGHFDAVLTAHGLVKQE